MRLFHLGFLAVSAEEMTEARPSAQRTRMEGVTGSELSNRERWLHI